MANMSVNVTYPYSDDYEYETILERINFDDERDVDLLTNNGFIVSDSNGIKKDLKDPYSIFSPKFGQTLKDLNPFANRYRCDCGQTQHKINDGIKCKHCGTKVRYVDDNFDYTGWIVLKEPYVIIHPGLFKSIEFVIGKDTLNNILKVEKPKDDDGHEMDITPPADEPFFNIGMMEFSERFDEIMKYYINKKKTKLSYYEDIMQHR